MSVPPALLLRQASPRFNPRPTPWASRLLHTGVAVLWVILLGYAVWGQGLSKWAVGLVYVGYDSFLLGFTFIKCLPLRRSRAIPILNVNRPTLTVIIATYNEASVLAATINALFAQSEPPQQIVIADDGSTDDTDQLLADIFGLHIPKRNTITRQGDLVWLRGEHCGKAAILNLALPLVTTELVVTVDADTQLAHDALAAMRDGFCHNPGLVAATGVLAPSCPPSIKGKIFETFQTYEYMRNFLSRYAWDHVDSLLLISGAFAGFRTDALNRVGGFDPDCMVEDYELIHRLRRYGYDYDLDWHTAVLGQARAVTSAPSSVLGFLRQRRRWFGGFLQTHYWYRAMVGNWHYGRLGTQMLPVKTMDRFQPIYGLSAFLLLLGYILRGNFLVITPILVVMLVKIMIDMSFHLWSIRLYRHWIGGKPRVNPLMAIVISLIEPFSFQLLRHVGACWGWWVFLTGRSRWESQRPVRRAAPS